jgi:hypothetical protein
VAFIILVFKFINVKSIISQLIADACGYTITRQPLQMPMACQKFVLSIEKGRKEEASVFGSADTLISFK